MVMPVLISRTVIGIAAPAAMNAILTNTVSVGNVQQDIDAAGCEAIFSDYQERHVPVKPADGVWQDMLRFDGSGPIIMNLVMNGLSGDKQ